MNVITELLKLPAFVRRDLRIARSYRAAIAAGAVGLAIQAMLFSFVGKLVDPARLPTFGGTHATYLEFVAIGLGLNLVVAMMLHQVAATVRNEQMFGTLESLLVTPTKPLTVQAGSVMFQLLSIPLRMIAFVALVGLVFGLDFHGNGVLPALAVLLAFLPFLWGLGLLSAGAVLTFRLGVNALTVVGTVFGIASGTFFPLALLPHWVQEISRFNPLAIAIQGIRETLIGGTGWATAAEAALKLAPFSIASLVVGVVAFRLALARERRLGTLGLY